MQPFSWPSRDDDDDDADDADMYTSWSKLGKADIVWRNRWPPGDARTIYLCQYSPSRESVQLSYQNRGSEYRLLTFSRVF
jgi:hypothetical protein